MYRDMVEWRGQNPPPGTMMIISDQVEGDLSWDLARLQQRTRYQLFLAYSIKPCHDLFLLYRANWRWEQLLEEEGAAPLVVDGLSSAAMFYCKSCNFDCQSLEKFRKHLSSYKHGMEVSKHPIYLKSFCFIIWSSTLLSSSGGYKPSEHRTLMCNGDVGKELPGHAWTRHS